MRADIELAERGSTHNQNNKIFVQLSTTCEDVMRRRSMQHELRQYENTIESN